MIRSWGGFLAVGALAASLSAGQPAGPAAPGGAVRQQLLDLEQVWVKAEIDHDAATLQRILDDQFVSTSGSGRTVDKAAFIRDATGGSPDPTLTQVLSDHTIRIDGDTAVVVETDTVGWTREGKKHTSVLRITVTYLRRNGCWVALAEHMATMPPAP